MECKTKTGLFLLMIMQIIAIISVVVTYGLLFSINLENLTSESSMNMVYAMIPTAIVGGVGGIIGLIGAIFILIGRKEFGEKHQKFVYYAILVFVISIVVTVIITVLIAAYTFSYVSQGISNPEDSTQLFDSIQSMVQLIVILAPVTAALGGLMWVFALYQLENENGKKILFAAFILSIVISVVISFMSTSYFNDFFRSEAFEELINSGSSNSSSLTQFSSYYQWLGPSAIVSLIGNVVLNGLWFLALYIPYKRIISGELVPISPVTKTSEPDRKCPNCGQAIPFDANICPYCSKKFEDFL